MSKKCYLSTKNTLQHTHVETMILFLFGIASNQQTGNQEAAEARDCELRWFKICVGIFCNCNWTLLYYVWSMCLYFAHSSCICCNSGIQFNWCVIIRCQYCTIGLWLLTVDEYIAHRLWYCYHCIIMHDVAKEFEWIFVLCFLSLFLFFLFFFPIPDRILKRFRQTLTSVFWNWKQKYLI